MKEKLCLLTAVLLGGCAAVSVDDDTRTCTDGNVTIDARFEGGDLDACRIGRNGTVELTFLPEDEAVSDSFSWFAFRIAATQPQEVALTLNFPGAYPRFWPKISRNGVDWEPAAPASVQQEVDAPSMRLTIAADAAGTWVAAQELLTLPWYDAWTLELGGRGDLAITAIGTSVQGRQIRLVRSAERPEAIVLLGRQHPAETPGALAMREFVDIVLADTPLARQFRERFMLVMIPLLNPDGVVNGHARHNSGGTDLNRDWGPFTQPETGSVAAYLDELDRAGIRPRLMLDFHATRMSPTMIFYTQLAEDDTDPPQFAGNWLGRADARIEDYEFAHDARAPSGLDNTKNYFFSRYGIPAITYEIGDEADRAAVERYTPVFAEEMMQVMLEAGAPVD